MVGFCVRHYCLQLNFQVLLNKHKLLYIRIVPTTCSSTVMWDNHANTYLWDFMVFLKPLEGRGGRRSFAFLQAHSHWLETEHMWIQNEDTDLNLLISSTGGILLILWIYVITWTNKRMVMFLNKLSSSVVFSRFDHTLAADIRGITEASSSKKTSKGKMTQYVLNAGWKKGVHL